MSKEQSVEAVMKQLKKDWEDIARREHVSEVGLDVDRAELIARYREEGLTQKQIAKALSTEEKEFPQQRISQLLIYQRYIASTTNGCTRIPERRFRKYWDQVRDSSVTQGRRKPDPTYEAACFADIRKLVEAGIPPQPEPKREKPIEPKDIRGIKDVTKVAKRIYRGRLKTELERLKGLKGADRSTYAPTLIADATEAIEEEILKLFRLLTESTREHAEADAADSGK